MTDFIYRKENALSDSLCRSLIEIFEVDKERQKSGVVRRGDEIKPSAKHKTSTDISFTPNDLQDKLWGKSLEKVIHIVEKGRADWIQQYYRGLESVDPFEINYSFNIQRFLPGEGYHVYHCERASWGTRDRVGVWMIYLNDVHDRGWTEFYYQQHYEKAEAGKLVCWPCDFTHLHRGIVSHTETKYIITGWFTLINPKHINKVRV